VTNLLKLPTFQNTCAFAIATNGDWLDSIFFAAPGQPANPIAMTGAITSGSNSVTVTSTQGLLPGLPVVQIPGVPAGVFVGAITSSAVFTMVDANGNPVDATATNAEAALTFLPLPLDLTGILFKVQVRAAANGQQVYLNLNSTLGGLVNGAASGVLSFDVTQPTIAANLPAGSYVVDIVAEGDGHTLNLFPEGPASLTVSAGITQP
jgi:hypothetical protein